jgi:hypothetical protein
MNSLLRAALVTVLLLASLYIAARILEHSVNQALKSLKLALKFEFTSNVGKVNLAAMILFAVLIFAFNLDQVISDSLAAGRANPPQNHVTGPAILLGLLFIGSVLCVMVVEKQK